MRTSTSSSCAIIAIAACAAIASAATPSARRVLNPRPDVTITVEFHNETPSLDMKVIAPSNRWLGVGGNSKAAMIGTLAHICDPNDNGEYKVWKLASKVVPVGAPEGSQIDGVCAPGSLNFTVSGDFDQWSTLVWAMGYADEAFQYHEFAGSLPLEYPAGFGKGNASGDLSAACAAVAGVVALVVAVGVAL